MKLNERLDLEVAPSEMVVAILSAQIYECLKCAASEQYFPSSDPDKMDNTIKGNLERAAKLRELREAYENLASSVLIERP